MKGIGLWAWTSQRPLSRQYDGNQIAATLADWEVSWEEDGRTIRAEIWNNLVLPGVMPDLNALETIGNKNMPKLPFPHAPWCYCGAT